MRVTGYFFFFNLVNLLKWRDFAHCLHPLGKKKSEGLAIVSLAPPLLGHNGWRCLLWTENMFVIPTIPNSLLISWTWLAHFPHSGCLPCTHTSLQIFLLGNVITEQSLESRSWYNMIILGPFVGRVFFSINDISSPERPQGLSFSFPILCNLVRVLCQGPHHGTSVTVVRI